MSIKDKLSMYGGTAKPVARATPAAEEGLSFGDLQLIQKAPFVYERALASTDALRGSRSLADYFPFSVTGILELSLSGHADAVHPEELLFLDTETTGLSRGAGTFPFLVGLGHLQQNRFVVRQLLLTSPAGEGAFLEEIQKSVRERPFLVTYNGKSFDVPLIRNRLILARDRLQAPVQHFDLFHILKRLYPHKRLAGYRQKDLEQELLGSERVGDIEGAAIPQIYFDYVKYGTDTGMSSIIEHNYLDLVGMIFLFLEAVQLYERKDVSRKSLRAGLARILARNHRFAEALEIAPAFEDLPLEAAEGFHYRDALFRAWLERRVGDFEKAAASFRTIADRCSCDYSRLSLVRILEYRLRDFEEALGQSRLLLTRAQDKERESLERRIARLETRIAREDHGA